MQCRCEWKLARVASGVSAMRVQIMVCIPGRDDLICSRGLNAVIPTENMHRARGFRKESSYGWRGDDSCGNNILGVTATVGIATLNPRLNMDYPLSG